MKTEDHSMRSAVHGMHQVDTSVAWTFFFKEIRQLAAEIRQHRQQGQGEGAPGPVADTIQAERERA